mgnify:CR=1 FL=1
MATLDEGVLMCCALCDSYFILITGGVTPAAWRGRNGTKALDERNHRAQLCWEEKRWALLRCATCVECLSGQAFLDWHQAAMRDTELLTPLSPCFAVTFDDAEPPPLFVDKQASAGGKPKWTLASGVGPAGLELDSSRSNRLWKASLRPFGIEAPRYVPPAELDAGWHAEIVRRVEAALESLAAAERDERNAQQWEAELAQQETREAEAAWPGWHDDDGATRKRRQRGTPGAADGAAGETEEDALARQFGVAAEVTEAAEPPPAKAAAGAAARAAGPLASDLLAELLYAARPVFEPARWAAVEPKLGDSVTLSTFNEVEIEIVV